MAVLLFTACGRRTGTDVPRIDVAPLDPALATVLEGARSRLESAPRSADAWGRYGQALQAGEFPGPASVCYRRAIELDPASAKWPHLLGLLELQHDPEGGLARLERAAELAGDTPGATRLRLAQALIEHGRPAEAERHLKRILARQPDHPAARVEWTRLQLSEGRIEGLADPLAPALTNTYTRRPALQLLSQIRAREGEAGVAADLASQASRLPRPYDWPDPFLQEVQALREDRTKLADRANRFLAERRFDEAEATIRELLERQPREPEVLLLAGRALLLQRRCDEAEARFREHLEVAGETLNGLTQLALSLLCQQRWSNAVPILERTLAIKPDLAQAYANLGLARARLGDLPAAIRSYEDALRCQPGDPSHHAALAEVHERQGDRERALDHVGRALRIDPRQPKALAIRQRLSGSPP